VRRDGYHWRQAFSLGVPDADLERLEPLGEDDEVGTTITFYASPTIFETTHYNWQTLATRFREMAFLNKGLSIT
jgi:DNA gyrase subunit B